MPVPSHQWFKLFSREWLRGTIRFDMDAAERGLWADILALSNESRHPGLIQANEGQPYPHKWLANYLNVPIDLLERSLAKFKESDRIRETAVGIEIVNWEKYQETNRAKPSDANAPDPTVTKIAKMLEKERGFVSPNYAEEASAIKWMLVHDYTPEEIMGCYRHLRADKWWSGKPLTMSNVKKNIGAWKGGPREPPGLAGLPEVKA